MFFVGEGLLSPLLSALGLTLLILLGIFMTFLTSWILSKTVLRGTPSSFTLELPPYRRPQIGRVLVRSIFDRTIFVLGRAVSVAAPAGLILFLLANIELSGASLLTHLSGILDPFARLFGLDGVILLAFILGFPANEIVLPIIVMAYLMEGSLSDLGNLTALRELLVQNGWTVTTAISVMLFSLMHWPCSTTCLTIKKESGSWKWTALSVAVPAVAGFSICFLWNTLASLFLS